MKRQYTDSYQCKAINGMVSVLGSKKVITQAPPSLKASRKKLLHKMIKYIARSGWKP
ncbi:hypothetical protein PB55_80 [Pseudomonas phage vB_PaeM_B55]|uniref:Uncharacterized protein n=3 Tax=Pakpunavirus TaxID=1921407 RepID=A0A5B7LVU4_9CAUD|nr:hypothetical protein BIZ94_gp009 [Pseudomonas phage vB_PaeM_MAG1]YP_010762474.1 hypothetical protein QE324_gp174 [Pseudomonas phage ITTPL]YP_010764665.1 hypothetical protein QE344_gp119 [Pseudomonas phage vB_PaeM_B55]WJJ54571.1 hypothetical protein PT07_00180 [Pseudomonas phage PT07]ALA11989.1 hypothetical protein vB_PaeM_MAG1_009 [Pseudomonas phage vB_PaeM_MAG1]QBP28189.1 hypothetical protein IttPL_0175 [Pseudomonas phage ITTPL]WBY51932.1 hypothetical protein PB55_80 [Pseudomonas phage vB